MQAKPVKKISTNSDDYIVPLIANSDVNQFMLHKAYDFE